jgi:hypothetical protein
MRSPPGAGVAPCQTSESHGIMRKCLCYSGQQTLLAVGASTPMHHGYVPLGYHNGAKSYDEYPHPLGTPLARDARPTCRGGIAARPSRILVGRT